MSRPRNKILFNGSITIVTWKCEGDNLFIQADETKDMLKKIFVKYKTRYNMKVLEYIILDGSFKAVFYVEDVRRFSNFMRDVNSVFAKFVNIKKDRRGGVIMDRFRSPVIEKRKDLFKSMAHIWTVMINEKTEFSETEAKQYKYCSLYSRNLELDDPMINSYSEFCKASGIQPFAEYSDKRFALELLNKAINKFLRELQAFIFEHVHSVGSGSYINSRRSWKWAAQHDNFARGTTGKAPSLEMLFG